MYIVSDTKRIYETVPIASISPGDWSRDSLGGVCIDTTAVTVQTLTGPRLDVARAPWGSEQLLRAPSIATSHGVGQEIA